MTQPLIPSDKLHDRIADLTRENAKLRAENQRLGGASTMMGCKACGHGVRPRDAVAGMCGDCAAKRITELEIVAKALADNQRPFVPKPVLRLEPKNKEK